MTGSTPLVSNRRATFEAMVRSVLLPEVGEGLSYQITERGLGGGRGRLSPIMRGRDAMKLVGRGRAFSPGLLSGGGYR